MIHLQAGDRIRLDEMPSDPCPIPPGTTGTVESVKRFHEWVQVWVKWDIDRSLALCLPVDRFTILPKEN